MDFRPGSDRLGYPGDDAMTWLKQNANLRWAGFCLPPEPISMRVVKCGCRASKPQTRRR
jgi:hypothetical protein